MKKIIKNIDPAGRVLPIDGTEEKIQPGQERLVEVTQRINYMVNNGFFEYVEGNIEQESTDEKVEEAVTNIDKEQSDFFDNKEAGDEPEEEKAIETDVKEYEKPIIPPVGETSDEYYDEEKPKKKKGRKSKKTKKGDE